MKLNQLTEEDTFILMLLMLQENKKELELLKEAETTTDINFDVTSYLDLANLMYCLDRKNLLKFLKYFGGTTIRIPTIQEFKKISYCISLYYLIYEKGISIDKAYEIVGVSQEECQISNVQRLFNILKNKTLSQMLNSRKFDTNGGID